MPLKIYAGTAAKDPVRATVTVAGAYKSVRRFDIYADGEWHLGHSFIQPLSLSASPSEVSGDGDLITGQTVYSNAATATPSGGKGPFTYSWTRTGGASVSIVSPHAATTSFRIFLPRFGSASASFQCVCTDSLGQTATANVTAQFSNGF